MIDPKTSAIGPALAAAAVTVNTKSVGIGGYASTILLFVLTAIKPDLSPALQSHYPPLIVDLVLGCVAATCALLGRYVDYWKLPTPT
jgi:hypothetical protein